MSLPLQLTFGEKYDPAMRITDQAEADGYLELCVKHTMELAGVSREEAERLERMNLGYWAGYFDHETRQRVERLFKCEHPFLGPAGDQPADPRDVFIKGLLWGIERGRR